jgi:hypothetical protein
MFSLQLKAWIVGNGRIHSLQFGAWVVRNGRNLVIPFPVISNFVNQSLAAQMSLGSCVYSRGMLLNCGFLGFSPSTSPIILLLRLRNSICWRIRDGQRLELINWIQHPSEDVFKLLIQRFLNTI